MEIKFRGRYKGKYIYGDLTYKYGDAAIFVKGDNHYFDHCYQPNKNSIAQLATHDDEDNEVYTGDEVHADNGEDYFVELRPVFVNVDGGEILLNPPKHFTLKR